MTEMSVNEEQPKTVGKKLTTLGLGMLTTSIILVFAGVSGAMLHNVLQVGGIGIALVGFVIWKVFKR